MRLVYEILQFRVKFTFGQTKVRSPSWIHNNVFKRKLEISNEWKSYLKARKGIYLISDIPNGKLYVGSAYGKDGIYALYPKKFRYFLLETFTDEISDEDIIKRKSWWKKRLLTKEYGYNANITIYFLDK